MPSSNPKAQGDRNLLFGILALQMDFISRDALIAAMHAWVLNKSKPLSAVLVEQGQLATEVQSVLEALVAKHVEQHQGDPQQSLAALRMPPAVQRELEEFADPDVSASLARVPRVIPASLAQGTTLPYSPEDDRSDGRFDILRRHAWGGLGEVYVARDRELHREVALKRLHERHADNKDSRARFLQEAEVTGGLEHPGIVPVYGLGASSDGRPYYAMRFIRGQTFKEAIEQFYSGKPRSESERRIELRQLLTRFVAVCNAIEYAHSRGVIHRDIKPSNIMLGKYGETLVVDWGLAKALKQRSEHAPPDEHTLVPSSGSGSSETLPGSAIGTPAYMSPEQSEGRIDEIGPASDVYSLGATLYSILTGKDPFESSMIGVILAKVQTGDFVPPRERNPTVPRALDAVCLKAMSLQPQDRYPSCAALASDVEHWLADEPVTALADPLSDRAIRWIKRHRVLAATAAALMTAAIISLLVGTTLLGRANREIQKANHDIETAAAEARSQRDEATEQRRVAVVERRRADASATEADQRRREAELQRDLAERTLYVSHINSAQAAWEANDAAAAWSHLNACRWDLRGWEHRYLSTLFDRNQTTLGAHQNRVQLGVFSPDGKRLATGDNQGIVKVWDLEGRRELLELKQTNYTIVSDIAFSPDGKKLVVGTYDQTARVWDADDGRQLLTLAPGPNGVLHVAFSPDGRRIATAGWEHTLKIWDAANGRELLTLVGAEPTRGIQIRSDGKRRPGNPISIERFSSDGKRLCSGDSQGNVKIWDAANGHVLLSAKIKGPALSPDFARIAGQNEDKSFQVWDAATGKPILTFRGADENGYGAAFSPDGRQIATTTWDGSVSLWDATSGQKNLTFKTDASMIDRLTFSPDGKRLLCRGSADRVFKIWDTSTGQAVFKCEGPTDRVYWAAFSPSGSQVASGGDDKTVRLWEVSKTHDVSTAALSPQRSSDDGTWAVGVGAPGLYAWEPAGGEMRTLPFPNERGGVSDFAFSPRDPRIVALSFGKDGVFDVWDVANGKKIRAFEGHKSAVRGVAYSPNGRQIVTGSDDKSVKVWDASSGRQLLSLEGHAEPVGHVAFSPDGDWIAGASTKTLKIWRATDGRELRTIPFKTPAEFLFSSDGKRILIRDPRKRRSETKFVEVWDVESGRQTIDRTAHPNVPYEAAEFSPDGKRLVIVNNRTQDKIDLYDVASGDKIRVLKPNYIVNCIAFSPRSNRIASGGDRIVDIWDISSGHKLVSFKGHTAEVDAVAFSPDGSRLVSIDRERTLKLWEASTGVEMLSLKNPQSLFAVRFNPAGDRIVAKAGYALRSQPIVWEATAREDLLSVTASSSSVHFSPDGTKILSSTTWTAVSAPAIWDVKTGEMLVHFPVTDGVSTLGTAFSPSGAQIVSANGKGEVSLWNARTAELIRTMKATNDPFTCVAFGPDENTIVTGGQDHSVRIWNSAAGKLTQTFQGHTGAVNSVAISRGGRIASGSADQTTKVWEMSQAKEIATLRGHAGEVAGVAFSPDGKWIASGSTDNTIKLWDAASGRELRTLKGHRQTVQSVAFSPDGKLVASASDDSTVRIWSVGNGKELRLLRGHTTGALDVAFSPDGRRLVSGGPDRINVWRLTDVGCTSP
jgi:WD40 repeat protein/serine/threonine protein kinase